MTRKNRVITKWEIQYRPNDRVLAWFLQQSRVCVISNRLITLKALEFLDFHRKTLSCQPTAAIWNGLCGGTWPILTTMLFQLQPLIIFHKTNSPKIYRDSFVIHCNCREKYQLTDVWRAVGHKSSRTEWAHVRRDDKVAAVDLHVSHKLFIVYLIFSWWPLRDLSYLINGSQSKSGNKSSKVCNLRNSFRMGLFDSRNESPTGALACFNRRIRHNSCFDSIDSEWEETSIIDQHRSNDQ